MEMDFLLGAMKTHSPGFLFGYRVKRLEDNVTQLFKWK